MRKRPGVSFFHSGTLLHFTLTVRAENMPDAAAKIQDLLPIHPDNQCVRGLHRTE